MNQATPLYKHPSPAPDPQAEGLDERAALLLETFARFGMQHIFKDGEETPNAKLARETAAALRSHRAPSRDAVWVSVAERLPEDGVLCVVIDDGEVTVGKRYSGQRGKKKIVKYAGWQLGEELCDTFGMADEYRNTITHWMPLPPAPCAEKGET